MTALVEALAWMFGTGAAAVALASLGRLVVGKPIRPWWGKRKRG